MRESSRELWLTAVEPYEGESISHFLGRFRRAKGNRFSAASGLGQVADLGAVLVRWENLHFNPFPSDGELENLAAIAQLEIEQIRAMFPSPGMTTQPKPILLCAACYIEKPCHQIKCQDKKRWGCDRHQLRLLSKCTNCGTPFPIPSLWVTGECPHCFLRFHTMAKRQSSL